MAELMTVKVEAVNFLEIPRGGIRIQHVMKQVQVTLIKRAIDMAHGNLRQAADLLDLNRTTLGEQIKRLKLELYLAEARARALA